MNFIIIVMSYTKIYFKIAVYNDEFKNYYDLSSWIAL